MWVCLVWNILANNWCVIANCNNSFILVKLHALLRSSFCSRTIQSFHLHLLTSHDPEIQPHYVSLLSGNICPSGSLENSYKKSFLCDPLPTITDSSFSAEDNCFQVAWLLYKVAAAASLLKLSKCCYI